MKKTPEFSYNYWKIVWTQFKKSKIGLAALWILAVFLLIGLYAPLLASSKPSLVLWNKKLYFPLFRYLFYRGFYTKPIDLFYNILIFTLPLALIGIGLLKGRIRKFFIAGVALMQIVLFVFLMSGSVKDPASNPAFLQARLKSLEEGTPFREDPLLASLPLQKSWAFELQYMTPYEQLNPLFRHNQRQTQQARLAPYTALYEKETGYKMPSLMYVEKRNETTKRNLLLKAIEENKQAYQEGLDRLPALMAAYLPFSHAFISAKYDLENATKENHPQAHKHYQEIIKASSPFRNPLVQTRQVVHKHQKATAQLHYLDERKEWIESESARLKILIPPLIRPFHWEEDAGGAQTINKYVPWWESTRINRKDLIASLIFGIRISLVVGIMAISLALLIGIPMGLMAGYFAGKADLIICRLIEIWEAMPTFFMLLLVIAITQSKSIFLVIAVLGLFGWTTFARFMRAEVLKQRNLPYVLACKNLGYGQGRIMFSHIFPNAVAPILTLLPFAMMVAITSEAGLSFLGLGEEGSTSWGVLMDEGRSVFPSESYLLWPPAILLTLLLICIALVGDVVRDAIDPKMRQ